jgi:imidazoleglycerol-phosphate dehydratase
MPRKATVERKTNETQIQVQLDLDGRGKHRVTTPVPFLTHMLDQLGRHGMFDMKIKAAGDVEVDAHHTTEDLGITLGQALSEALGDRAGIRRFGFATVPMDEACVTCALDLSGRPYFAWRVPLPKAKVGDFDAELAEVFFNGFVRGAGCNLHMRLLEGESLHHIIEVCFKAFARALRDAVERDPRAGGIPSTKGRLKD